MIFGKKNLNIKFQRSIKPAAIIIPAVLILLVILAVISSLGFAAAVAAALIIAGFLVWKLFIYNQVYLDEETVVDFFGRPGSGKTFFATREASKFKDRTGTPIVANTTLNHYRDADFLCTKQDLGYYDMSGMLLVWDEGNLDGFDNRSSSQNFKDNITLKFFLMHRQSDNPIIFTQQGFVSLDKKIREDITTVYYLCKHRGPFVIAHKLYVDTDLDPITSEPIDYYVAARPIDAILKRDAYLFGCVKLQNRGRYLTKKPFQYPRGHISNSPVNRQRAAVNVTQPTATVSTEQALKPTDRGEASHIVQGPTVSQKY